MALRISWTVFSALSGTRLLACLIVRDAVSMIETWAGAEFTVTALLGHAAGDNTGDEMASDLAPMYAGKWHRWLHLR